MKKLAGGHASGDKPTTNKQTSWQVSKLTS
jgi:hypothetical protein